MTKPMSQYDDFSMYEVHKFAHGISPPAPTGPPKSFFGAHAHLVREKTWFHCLPKIHCSQLMPGDILLRKEYELPHIVITAQRVITTAPYGSCYTVHAILVMGAGFIGHATSTIIEGKARPLTPSDSRPHDGVIREYITHPYPKLSALVYRPSEPSAAVSAVSTMNFFISQRIHYGFAHPRFAGTHLSYFGTKAHLLSKHVSSGRIPVSDFRMMCSEAVVFSYQGDEFPYIYLDATATTPMRLENYLNTDRFFTLVGAIEYDLPAGSIVN